MVEFYLDAFAKTVSELKQMTPEAFCVLEDLQLECNAIYVPLYNTDAQKIPQHVQKRRDDMQQIMTNTALAQFYEAHRRYKEEPHKDAKHHVQYWYDKIKVHGGW
jgi:hypothetical protein